jgi:hypothetical protein
MYFRNDEFERDVRKYRIAGIPCVEARASLRTSMTTVTEAAKRLIWGREDEVVKSGDLGAICGDPLVAQRVARHLAAAAHEIAPGREWSIEDLRDVLEAACTAGPRADGVRVLEGRYFRKRLRDQCALAERYGDPFALVVYRLRDGDDTASYARLLDQITERLRRTDMVFVYRRRFAILLPRMRATSLDSLIGRVAGLLDPEPCAELVESVERLTFPDDAFEDTQAVLDWAEDQLR